MIQENISLQPYHTFGLDVHARWWIDIQEESSAQYFFQNNPKAALPLWILGGGSNVLFTKDYEGLILKNNILGKELLGEEGKYTYLKAGAGENWHQLVQYCLGRDWGGIENLSLIPGCIGAAPIQNIGAYGVELKDVFEYLEAIEVATGKKRRFGIDECAFGYRDSIFKGKLRGKYLITAVVLRLTKSEHQLNIGYGSIKDELGNIQQASIQEISAAVCKIRQSKLPDPAKIGNAGSFFKNPLVSRSLFEEIQSNFPNMPFYEQEDGQLKIPAGWLIQSCGWKGRRFGNYGVHPHQALVLVNYGGATGREIYELSTRILESVKQQFGIELEREVNIV